MNLQNHWQLRLRKCCHSMNRCNYFLACINDISLNVSTQNYSTHKRQNQTSTSTNKSEHENKSNRSKWVNIKTKTSNLGKIDYLENTWGAPNCLSHSSDPACTSRACVSVWKLSENPFTIQSETEWRLDTKQLLCWSTKRNHSELSTVSIFRVE
jgi:hypothetical protein